MTSNDREGNPGPGTPEDATRTDWTATPPPVAPAAGPPPGSPPPAGPPPGSPPPASPPPVMPAQYPGYPAGPVAGSAPGMAWAPPPEAYGAVQAGGLRYGGTTARFLAWVLDGLLIAIFTFVVGFILAIVGLRSGSTAAAWVSVIITIGVEALYFIGSWTSSSKATLGMRLFNLQVGNAANGASLSIAQAVTRFVAIGLPFQALSLAPPPLNGLVLLVSLWELILLISTIVSPTKQGIHDKIANSAMVQPIGREGPVVACLILLGIFLVLPFVAIVALIFLGGQISGILETVGNSV